MYFFQGPLCFQKFYQFRSMIKIFFPEIKIVMGYYFETFPFWGQPQIWIIACEHYTLSFSGIFSFLLTFSKDWIIDKLFAINTYKLMCVTRMLFCVVGNQFVVFKSNRNDLVHSKSFEFTTAIFDLQIYQHIWAPQSIKH